VGVLYFKFRKVKKISYIIPAAYISLIALMYFLWEPNPDQIEIPMSVVNTFRTMSGLTMAIFFLLIGVVFGSLWKKYRPDESPKIAAV